MLYGNRDYIIARLLFLGQCEFADCVRTGKIGPSRAAQLAGFPPLRKRVVLSPPPPKFVPVEIDPEALIG